MIPLLAERDFFNVILLALRNLKTRPIFKCGRWKNDWEETAMICSVGMTHTALSSQFWLLYYITVIHFICIEKSGISSFLCSFGFCLWGSVSRLKRQIVTSYSTTSQCDFIVMIRCYSIKSRICRSQVNFFEEFEEKADWAHKQNKKWMHLNSVSSSYIPIYYGRVRYILKIGWVKYRNIFWTLKYRSI